MRTILTLVAVPLLALPALASPLDAAPEVALASSDFVRAIQVIPIENDFTEPIPAHLPLPAAATGIGPGSHLLITMAGGLYGCTANFIWESGNTKYLGAAGHCFMPEGYHTTHGSGVRWTGATNVRVCVSSCLFGGEAGFFVQGQTVALGPLAYARQELNGQQLGEDFGIVQIPSSLAAQIRPSMPVWGGPSTVQTLSLGKPVCHYGNGVVVGETMPTMARAGVGISTSGAGYWLADTASAFGDSGSAVVTCGIDSVGVHGIGAVGALTHITVNLGITAGTTVAKAQAMTQRDANIAISPVMGP